VHGGGFELLAATDDPDVVVVRAHHHTKLVVFAIVGPVGAAVAAWFEVWAMAVFGLLLATFALLVRARRTVIDRRARRFGERFAWSRSTALSQALGAGPVALKKRVRRSEGTVEETYDVTVGEPVVASDLLWADADKLSRELASFLGQSERE
jgi:hypothetical protein